MRPNAIPQKSPMVALAPAGDARKRGDVHVAADAEACAALKEDEVVDQHVSSQGDALGWVRRASS